MPSLLARFLAVFISSILAISSLTIISAQDTAARLAQQSLGPYEITVYSQPPRPTEGLGAPRFSVAVTSAPEHSPVSDAEVLISMRRPDGTDAGVVPLNQNPVTDNLYEARLTLADVGVWQWTVAVESPLGLESIEGNIEVIPGPSSGRAGTIAWGILIGILLTGGCFCAYKLRPSQRTQV